MAEKKDVKAAPGVIRRVVIMRCGVCGADCYSDGTKDCDCDAYDYGRMMPGRYE